MSCRQCSNREMYTNEKLSLDHCNNCTFNNGSINKCITERELEVIVFKVREIFVDTFGNCLNYEEFKIKNLYSENIDNGTKHTFEITSQMSEITVNLSKFQDGSTLYGVALGIT